MFRVLHRDQEGSPTGKPLRLGGLSYGDIACIEIRRALLQGKRHRSESHETLLTTTSYETPLFYEIPFLTAGGMPPVLNDFLGFSVNLHIPCCGPEHTHGSDILYPLITLKCHRFAP